MGETLEMDIPGGEMPTSKDAWLYKVGMALLAVVILASSLYVKLNYVSQDKYEADRKTDDAKYAASFGQQQEILLTLREIKVEIKQQDVLGAEMLDHEKRLREVERATDRLVKSP